MNEKIIRQLDNLTKQEAIDFITILITKHMDFSVRCVKDGRSFRFTVTW